MQAATSEAAATVEVVPPVSQVQGPLSPRSARYERIIHKRSSEVRRYLANVVSLAVQPGDKGGIGIPGMSAVGSNLYFTIRRAWVPSGQKSKKRDIVSIVLAGYRAGYQGEGQALLGGPARNAFAYDMRYVPVERGAAGKIMSWDRPDAVELALQMELTAERSMRDGSLLRGRFDLPRFWASFDKSSVPLVEDTPAARSAALQVLHPDYRGPVLPSLRAPGGVVSVVYPEVDGIGIGFGGSGGTPLASTDDQEAFPDEAVMLPPCAVLRPSLKVGTRFDKGAALADFAPRRMYPGWNGLLNVIGEAQAAWLLRDVVQASEIHHNGRVLRPIEFCPEGAKSAVQVVEDIRHMMSRRGQPVTQVVHSRDGSALSGSTASVGFDLKSLDSRWAHEFTGV